ncbi:hypothetical protein [uncultured Tateyamaria sp.]|uniref:hypothetical protein n=1 Tax=uncultured Tateyamaria sp. TaxID=455651 RepID=UPI00261BF847|nr:hypothetical protein [uncultured Tateyamaria sp.]
MTVLRALPAYHAERCGSLHLTVLGAACWVYRHLERWPETQIEMSFSDRVDNVIEAGFDLSVRIAVTSPDQGFVVRALLRSEALL